MIGLLPLLAANPVEHVTDKPLIGWYVSNVTIMLVLSAVVTLLLIVPAAKKIAIGRGGGVHDYRSEGAWANFVEFPLPISR